MSKSKNDHANVRSKARPATETTPKLTKQPDRGLPGDGKDASTSPVLLRMPSRQPTADS
jgi:hypothetical protein